MGVAIKEDGQTVGFFSPKKTPHLVNLNEDATLSECLLYYIKEGLTRIGSPEANIPQDIQLFGSHILSQHCIFDNCEGQVKLIPQPGATCFVNGRKIDSPTVLKTGSRVILGKNHVFRFNNPEQPREQPREQPAAAKSVQKETECADWDYAQEELMAKTGIDLKAEMAKKLKEMEVQWRKEKEQANEAFQQERKKYEDQIESLQKQVMEQSMTMSMYSSITPDEFNNEEDVFGKSFVLCFDIFFYFGGNGSSILVKRWIAIVDRVIIFTTTSRNPCKSPEKTSDEVCLDLLCCS